LNYQLKQTPQMKDKYNVVNGTSYRASTDNKIISVLENARNTNTRIELDYGNVETGESWGERYDILGYVGRSTGTSKIPLLVFNSRSMGGGGIMDNCIVRIRESKGKKVLYKHEFYTEYRPTDN